ALPNGAGGNQVTGHRRAMLTFYEDEPQKARRPRKKFFEDDCYRIQGAILTRWVPQRFHAFRG
ncbi:MAG: hypothetical protein LBI16_02725, partial [Burkholderiales bacterium]|nr:hypothetical protein [Burkholderiales bacterium]